MTSEMRQLGRHEEGSKMAIIEGERMIQVSESVIQMALPTRISLRMTSTTTMRTKMKMRLPMTRKMIHVFQMAA